jgi:hypothetical protein
MAGPKYPGGGKVTRKSFFRLRRQLETSGENYIKQSLDAGFVPIPVDVAEVVMCALSPRIAAQRKRGQVDFDKTIAQAEVELGGNPSPEAFLMTLSTIVLNELKRAELAALREKP